MKYLKVLVAALAISVASTSTALAQEKKGKMTPEQQLANIEQAAGSLTAEQKKKISDIIAKSNEAYQAIPKEERKEKGAAVNKKRAEDIRAVLTAEQRKKYDEAQAAAKKKN